MRVDTLAKQLLFSTVRVTNTEFNGEVSTGTAFVFNGGTSLESEEVVAMLVSNKHVIGNAAQIDFTGNALPSAGGNGATSASASNANGTIRAGITFGNGGMNVTLQTPAGMATQTIAPGGGRAGSVAQMLQIAGNNQQVANQLQLQLQTAQMSSASLRQAGVLQALQNAINARR